MLMSKPMPVKVLFLCSSASNPQELLLEKTGL
jgi:hypothetical protein